LNSSATSRVTGSVGCGCGWSMSKGCCVKAGMTGLAGSKDGSCSRSFWYSFQMPKNLP